MRLLFSVLAVEKGRVAKSLVFFFFGSDAKQKRAYHVKNQVRAKCGGCVLKGFRPRATRAPPTANKDYTSGSKLNAAV